MSGRAGTTGVAVPGWVFLAVTAGCLAAMRLASLREPPDWDVATYTVVAAELNAGERLYVDAWDNKPPAIFATYALGLRLLDPPWLWYALSVAAATAAVAGAWGTGGRWAGAFLAAVALDPRFDANLPNVEPFVNACVAGAWALLPGRRSATRAATAGALLGLALLYKQVAAPLAGALLLGELLRPSESRRGTTRPVAIAAGAALALLALAAGWFAATGRLGLLVDTIWTYPRHYGGDLLSNLAASLAPGRWRPVAPLWPLAALSAVALAIGPSSRRAPLALMLVAAHLAAALPGRAHTHYLQLWFVPLCVGAAWGLAALRRRVGGRWTATAGVAIVAALLAGQVEGWGRPGVDWARAKRGDLFTTAIDDVRALRGIVGPAPSLFVWGDEPWIYLELGARPSTPTLWRMHLDGGPLADALTRATLEALGRAPPRWVIFWGGHDPEHPVTRWIDAHYVPVDAGRALWPMELRRRSAAVDDNVSHASPVERRRSAD